MNCGETSPGDGNTQLSENDLTECMPVGVMSVKKNGDYCIAGPEDQPGVSMIFPKYVGSLNKNGGLRLERMNYGCEKR